MNTVLLAAGDDGPKRTLDPLAALGYYSFPQLPAADIENDDAWRRLIRSHHPPGLVCGTSDSAAGRAVEASARRAAATAGIPVVAIEDFPGSYYDVPSGPVALLIVESDAVANLARHRLGTVCPPLEVLSPARYDIYRREAAGLRARVRERWAEAVSAPAILWAGQPETKDCAQTLRCLLPAIRDSGLILLFKAHPRDTGHASGVYSELFVEFDVRQRDVTSLTVPEAMALAPRLVVTQFSSVAIEAGFYGIPSLSILLPEAGGARLLEKKGYQVPPYCEQGAADCVTGGAELPETLFRVVEDRVLRSRIIRCFDAYFHTTSTTLPGLVTTLKNALQTRRTSP